MNRGRLNDLYWLEGGDFGDMLAVVRDVPGRRYDGKERSWVLTVSAREAATRLQPYRLMHEDDATLSGSEPMQVQPL